MISGMNPAKRPAGKRLVLASAPPTLLPAAPGDVLAVPGGGPGGWLVRAGEWIARKPSPEGHVVIVTHQDKIGRWMGIQGQPGGVGLCDCTPFLNDARTSTNHSQPKPATFPGVASFPNVSQPANSRLTAFLASAAKSLGIGYDWVGIEEDAAIALGAMGLAAEIDRLWRWPAYKNLLPGHVVCSSLATMLYDLPAVAWAHPGLDAERTTLPSDWDYWNRKELWKSHALV